MEVKANITQLGEVLASIIGGGTPSRKNEEFYKGDIPWVTVKDLIQLRIDKAQEYITEEAVINSASNVIPKGTVIVATRMALGKAVMNSVDVAINQDLKALIPDKDKMDPEFLLHTMIGNANAIQSMGSGTTVKGIRLEQLKSLPVFIPTLTEQRKIADILNTIDNAISKTEDIIQQTEKVKKGLMQQLLTKGIGHTRFKQTEIGEIPEEWEVKNLDDYKQNANDVLRTGPFGSSLKSEHFQSQGIPVINIFNLGDAVFDTSELFYVSKDKALSLSSYVVKENDILFSRVADIGRSVVVPSFANGWVMSSNLMRIRVDTSKIVPQFLYYQIINGPFVRKQLTAITNNAGRPTVNSKVLMDLGFPTPPIAEQKKVVDILESVNLKIVQEKSKLMQLKNLRKGLMQVLLTGKVRVKVDDQEVVTT